MKAAHEQISHPHQSFRFLRFEVGAFKGRPHRHPHLELTWIESGEGVRFVGDSAEPFASQDLILLGSNTPHCWVSSKGSGRGIATVVQFPARLLEEATFPELKSLSSLAALATRGLAVTGSAQEKVIEILRGMQTAGELGRLAGLLCVLEQLAAPGARLRAVARHAMHIPLEQGGAMAAARRIDRVLGWVHRELGRELTVAEGARLAGVTPAAFSRFFRRQVGKTFTSYLNDVRCSEAAVRLRWSDDAVSAVAIQSGFSTLSHFNRQFRLRMKATPRQFRRRFRLAP